MVSIVPAGQAASAPPPRVMPKVFADVPTQRELDRAQQDLDKAQKDLTKAQRSRKATGGWVAVLLVMLVGAGGLLGWEFAVGRPAVAKGVSTESGNALKLVNDKLKTTEDALKKEGENNRKLSAVYEPFKAIALAEAEVVDYKKQIDERLAQYPAARDRTRIDFKDHWKAYDTALVWKGVNKAEVGQDLQTKSKLLVALLKKIDEIRPPTTTPVGAPACTDPARCAPTSRN